MRKKFIIVNVEYSNTYLVLVAGVHCTGLAVVPRQFGGRHRHLFIDSGFWINAFKLLHSLTYNFMYMQHMLIRHLNEFRTKLYISGDFAP